MKNPLLSDVLVGLAPNLRRNRHHNRPSFPQKKKTQPEGYVFFLFLQEENGRDGKIRTCDPLYPKQVRYQAALRPDL